MVFFRRGKKFSFPPFAKKSKCQQQKIWNLVFRFMYLVSVYPMDRTIKGSINQTAGVCFGPCNSSKWVAEFWGWLEVWRPGLLTVAIYKWIIMLEKIGRPDLNVFHLKWIIGQFGTHGNWKKSKSWGPFWSYQLITSANPAHLPQKWAKWADWQCCLVSSSYLNSYVAIHIFLSKFFTLRPKIGFFHLKAVSIQERVTYNEFTHVKFIL